MRTTCSIWNLAALHAGVLKKADVENLPSLQVYGVTEDQVLKLCRTFEANGPHNMNGSLPISSCQFSVF